MPSCRRRGASITLLPFRLSKQLGLAWGDKKSIVGRSTAAASVRAVCWPPSLGEPLLGDADGRVCVYRAGSAATPLYRGGGGGGGSGGGVVALIVSPSGSSLASAHADGSIHVFPLDARALARAAAAGDAGAVPLPPPPQAIAVHVCAPTVLAWAGDTILAVAGGDGRVSLYRASAAGAAAGASATAGVGVGGAPLVSFEASPRLGAAAAAGSPNGDAFVVGDAVGIRLFCRRRGDAAAEDGEGARWAAAGGLRLAGDGAAGGAAAAICALAWSSDGSRLAVGTMNGAVALVDAFERRLCSGKGDDDTDGGGGGGGGGGTRSGLRRADLLFASPFVAVAMLGRSRLVLRARDGSPLLRVRLHSGGRFVVAAAVRSLLLGDVEAGTVTEVDIAAAAAAAAAAVPAAHHRASRSSTLR